VLVVDDERSICEMLEIALRKDGHKVETVASGDNATEVSVTADVQFSGALAGLGQPLIKKKADAMVHEFAENLRKAIGAEA